MSSKKKLTLSIDETVIERARRYSRAHNTTISELVSNYLDRLDAPADPEYSPFVQRLRGLLSPDTSIEEYRQHLERKHC